MLNFPPYIKNMILHLWQKKTWDKHISVMPNKITIIIFDKKIKKFNFNSPKKNISKTHISIISS